MSELEPKQLAWSAFHSTFMDSEVPAKANTALLPMFREYANTPAMIHHAMFLIKQTELLHSGQVPVMKADQPLYALAKEIQWSNLVFLEKIFLVMIGDMHVEMTFMKCIGNILDGR